MAVYTLAPKHGLGEGDGHEVVCAHDLFHVSSLGGFPLRCPAAPPEHTEVDSHAAKPHHRLADRLADRLESVNALVLERTVSENCPRIPAVASHLIEAGGKRLRPMLTLAAADLCGGARGGGDILLAAAVEFIHTATLLHDDVVDGGENRRGRPSANLLWDNKSSVLVGDYLFSRAFRLMVETESLQALDILSSAAATIAEGEVLQLAAERSLETDEEACMLIARGKTAALFAAAAEAGAIVAGAGAESARALRDYGDRLGIAFQISDDLLDYAGDSSDTGKRPGNDFRERKLTLPAVKAVARADAEEREFWVRAIERGEQRDGDLERAIELMQRHGALEETRSAAQEWAAGAREALAPIPDHPVRGMLEDMADYVASRVS